VSDTTGDAIKYYRWKTNNIWHKIATLISMATQGIQPLMYRRLHLPDFYKTNAEIIWNYRQYFAY